MTPVRLEPAASRSRVKHSTTEPLGSLKKKMIENYPACKEFVRFVALRPKSTAVVMAGLSVHPVSHFFLGKLEQAVNQYFVHILSLVTDNNPTGMIQRKGGE